MIAGWTRQTVARHEAAHCAACLMLGREVASVSIDPVQVDLLGVCEAPLGDGVELRDVVVALVGPLAEGVTDWPPTWENARGERRESIGVLVDYLDLDETTWDRLVANARGLVQDPAFRELAALIERALLYAAPVLEGEDIIRLRDRVLLQHRKAAA